MSMTSGVYCIVNTVSWKYYIGSSVNIERRWTEHRRGLRRGDHVNPHLQHAWDMYGPDAFVLLVAEQTDDPLSAEQRWIDAAKDVGVATYNAAVFAAAPGRGRRHSLETRAKMSAWQIGRVHSPETIAKLRAVALNRSDEWRAKLLAAKTGKRLAPEHRDRVVAAIRNRTPEQWERMAASRIGLKRTAETRAKMSESAKAQWARRRGESE